MKQYNGEPAIISLTSWKARINTVGVTIYSLLKNCPGFHIVLVLSEWEFPHKERDLPKDLNVLANANKIEILYSPRNYKSFKKVLFSMHKWRNVPIISADDDCLYTFNYASLLYKYWTYNPKSIITINPSVHYGICFPHGPCTLYPPYIFGEDGLKYLGNQKVLSTNHDDVYYGILAFRKHIPIFSVPSALPYIFHDDINALSRTRTIKCHQAIRIILKEIK